jgi:sialidase-1
MTMNRVLKNKKGALVILLFSALVSNPALGQEEHDSIADGLFYQNLFDASGNDNVSCYRIPAIVTAPNGDLIVAIDERVPNCRDLKWSGDINIVYRKSSDNGETWSEIRTLVDYPLGQSASDPSMIVDEVTEEVILFYNYMDLDKEKDVYYLHMVKSSDSGETWSEPLDITAQISKPGWHNDFKFITSGRGIQTRSGKLIHTLVNLEKGLHLFASDDHGQSWYLIDTPIQPANESKIVELEDGTWMINSRVNGGGNRYLHLSKNEGQSWKSTAETQLIDPACNASIIRCTSTGEGSDKNRLLFSNAKMEEGRMNMTVRISYDEGLSWSKGKTIYSGPSAYSSMTILDNGEIGLVFEKDQYTENVFVRFTLDWLTDGGDRYE